MTARQVEAQELYARALHRFAQLRDNNERGHEPNQKIEVQILDLLLQDLDALQKALAKDSTANQSETPEEARWTATLQTHRPTPVVGSTRGGQRVIVTTDPVAILATVEQATSHAQNARNLSAASRQSDADREILKAEAALTSVGVASGSAPR